MKIYCIGDTHGRSNWKEAFELFIKNEENTDAKMVFIGDYFDSFSIDAETQLTNFNEICDLARRYKDRVVLLIGNHDFHYMNRSIDRYSGHSGRYHDDFYEAINKALNDNLLSFAYQQENMLFTHAGVTQTWYDNYMECCKKRLLVNDSMSIADTINVILKYENPLLWDYICFQYPERGDYSSYGDNNFQGPLWVRPNSLMNDPIVTTNVVQIVGHTRCQEISIKSSIENTDKFYFMFTDCLDNTNSMALIDTEEQELTNINF